MKKENLTKQIINLLNEAEKPLQLLEISKKFHITSSSNEYDELKSVLSELVDKSIIQKSGRRRYSIEKNAVLNDFIGIISIKKDTGILITDSIEFPKITIKRRNLLTALDGDTVVVRLLAQKKSQKPRGEVVSIIKRNKEIITGKIEFDAGFYFLIPFDEKYYIDFLIPKEKLLNAQHGDKVNAKFIAWEDQFKSPVAEVIRIIGKAGKPNVEYESIVSEFGLPKEFDEQVNKEANEVANLINDAEINKRLNLRNEDIITIDPSDAKDFDDAVSLKKLDNGNLLLGVHIADVSHFVVKDTSIDKEALSRGNSIYLVDRVIPMLPEIISNDICSLKPNVDRFAFSVLMEFTVRGVLKNYEIKESVINSKRRFSYDEVQEIITNKAGDYCDLILNLNKFANTLKKKRFTKGGVNFDTLEVKFILDENKYPKDVVLKTSNDATSLIEECMLIANKTVAEHIKKLSKTYRLKNTLAFLYRTHDVPNPDKINNFIRLCKSLGVKVKIDSYESKKINSLIEELNSNNDKYVLNQMLLRAMAKAEYSNINIGHYGLGFDDYTHFTSPIRRYPDLIVHRLLKLYNSDIPNIASQKKINSQLERIGYHCTDTERLAMEAERASIKLAHTVHTKNLVGYKFEGTISGVASFGMFVILDNIYAEGFVHIKDIRDDYYIYDEKNLRLVGKRYKNVYRVGNRVRVAINNVNIDRRKIDLKLLELTE